MIQNVTSWYCADHRNSIQVMRRCFQQFANARDHPVLGGHVSAHVNKTIRLVHPNSMFNCPDQSSQAFLQIRNSTHYTFFNHLVGSRHCHYQACIDSNQLSSMYMFPLSSEMINFVITAMKSIC